MTCNDHVVWRVFEAWVHCPGKLKIDVGRENKWLPDGTGLSCLSCRVRRSPVTSRYIGRIAADGQKQGVRGALGRASFVVSPFATRW